MAELWAPWVAMAFGLVNLVAGILAYRGSYRVWLLLKGSFLPGWPGLASLYLGFAFTLMGISAWVVEEGPAALTFLLFILVFPSLVLGIVAMFWLPSFLLPPWIKVTRQKIESGEDALSQAMAPGGALYRRLGVDPRHELRTSSEPDNFEGMDKAVDVDDA